MNRRVLATHRFVLELAGSYTDELLERVAEQEGHRVTCAYENGRLTVDVHILEHAWQALDRARYLPAQPFVLDTLAEARFIVRQVCATCKDV